MVNEFMAWLSEILSSFDGSDLLAFVAGCLAMVVWKNVKAIMWNRNNKSGGDASVLGVESGTAGAEVKGRKVDLPRMNRKYFIWIVVFVSMFGIMLSTFRQGEVQDTQAERMTTIALALCEGSKITRVEAKASADLFFAALNVPPEIAALPAEHPDRKAWGQGIGLKYLGTLEDAAVQRTALEEGRNLDPDFWERYFGPDRPEPNCERIR